MYNYDWKIDFCVFIFQFLVYFTSKVGDLKAIHYYMQKVKSNYFIVHPKVDQRAGLLSLPHLGNFRRTATFTTSALPRKHSPEGDTAAQQCRTSS